jgi:hypothetical protein
VSKRIASITSFSASGSRSSLASARERRLPGRRHAGDDNEAGQVGRLHVRHRHLAAETHVGDDRVTEPIVDRNDIATT